MPYISKQGLANLATYKYAGIDNSILARLFLNDYWNWVVSYMPPWLAPNVITFIGFIVIMINYATLAYFCPNLTGCSLPSWAYLSFAVGIWIYQTLDNIDGKQARRTGSSSPLGELFDHGCDSLFVSISGVTIVAALNASPWFAFIMLHTGILPFYYAHWEEYHTGILILGPLANPTEMQVLMVILHIVTSFTGATFWDHTLSSFLPAQLSAQLPDLISQSPLNQAVVVSVFFGSASLLFYNSKEVLAAAQKKGISALDACAPLVPLFVNLGATTAWFYLSPSKILEHHPLAAITLYGVVGSWLLIRLILDRITKCDIETWHAVLLVPVAGLFNAVFLKEFTNEWTVFWVLLATAIAMHLHMSYSIIKQLTKHLNIRAFHIPYPKA